MSRRHTLRSRLAVRLSIKDHEELKRWARAETATVGDVIRDLIRRERERRSWADRDSMAQLENAAATITAAAA